MDIYYIEYSPYCRFPFKNIDTNEFEPIYFQIILDSNKTYNIINNNINILWEHSIDELNSDKNLMIELMQINSKNNVFIEIKNENEIFRLFNIDNQYIFSMDLHKYGSRHLCYARKINDIRFNLITLHIKKEKDYLKIIKFLLNIPNFDVTINNNEIICRISKKYTSKKYTSKKRNKFLKIVKYLLSLEPYENDNNLKYLLNQIYQLNLDVNVNNINSINVLLWSIKLNKYNEYFINNFKEEYEIYDYLFNNKISDEFKEFINNNKIFKHIYIHLETICLEENKIEN